MKKLACCLSLLAAACAATPDLAPETPVTPGAPTMSPVTPLPLGAMSAAPVSSAAPAASEPPPPEIEYPFHGVDKIPDDCNKPSVVLTTAPTKMGWGYDWTWTRQAFYANPQFKIVPYSSEPRAPMEVKLEMYEIPAGFALVGVCHDGATCNKIAAMYRGTVPTCSPVLHCGALPIKGAPRQSALVPTDGKWLPDGVIGRCARIGVCMKMKHVPFTGNPGVACQSTPSKFKIDCASKATCDEVVACMR
jgi:hypothetical protein